MTQRPATIHVRADETIPVAPVASRTAPITRSLCRWVGPVIPRAPSCRISAGTS